MSRNGNSQSGLVRVLSGRPTEPQVRSLMEKFGKINRGDVVEHAAIESAINEKRTTGRYTSVVSRFRRRLLRERGIFLQARHGIGYEALAADRQLHRAASGVKSSNRALFRSLVIAELTPDSELNEHQRGNKLFILTHGKSLLESARSEARQMTYRLGPAEVLPRSGREP